MSGNKVVKNATWIIVSKIVQSLLGLIVNMFTSRYLGPSGYGLISYAASVVAFVVPIMRLGLDSILVQEVVNDSENEGKIVGTSIGMSFFSSFFTVGGVILFVSVANAGEKETIIVCALYSLLLIAQSIELIHYWFQAKLKSQYTSIVSLVAYVLFSGYKIFLLITGKNIYWFAIAQSIDYFIVGISLLIIYQKVGNQPLRFSWKLVKRLFKKSKYYIVSSMMVTIFAQTDRIMLKIMLGDAATGYYSAAVACAGMTSFVFGAIIDSMRPIIFEGKQTSQEKFEMGVSRLYSIIIYTSLLQSVLFTIFAPLIINILYGKQYLASISALQIIVWYTTFSYLGAVRNIWILAEGKQNKLWILNLSGALLNVLLNWLLIPVWGVNGAAIASLITQIFTNVIMNQIIKPIRGVNKLMFRGCNPRILVETCKIVFKRAK